jgi:hypothetical protein
MPSRRFPKLWSVEPMPGGYRVIDANGVVLAYVYGQPEGAIAVSETPLTSDEARRISKLIFRLPELVELERDRNKARSRRKIQPLRFKPVTIGDLIREGKLLEVYCGNSGWSGISISIPKSCACPSACRCLRWQGIWSAANAVREIARPTIGSGRGPMPG